MPVDSNIALSVATPQAINPIDNYTKAVALKDMMTQDKLRQQQIQQSIIQTQNLQAEAQARQRDLADENNWTQAVKSAQGDFGSAFDNLAKTGTVSASYLLSKRSLLDKLATDKLNLSEAQRKQEDIADDEIHKNILSVSALDKEQQPTQYANIMDSMSRDPKLAPRVQKGLQMGILQKQWPTEPQEYLDQLGVVRGGQAYINTQATEKQKLLTEQSTQNKNDAETANFKANLPKIKADAEEATLKLAGMKSTSLPDWDRQVDAVAPPGMTDRKELNTRTKELVHSALKMGDFKAAQAAIKDASDQIGRTETAVATARNTAPVKVDVHNEMAKADHDLITGNDEAYAGVSSKVVPVVRGLIEKSMNSLVEANSRARSLMSFIDAAEHGNRAAGTNLPLVSVQAMNAIAGIKRINQAEIHQNKDIGSMYDRVVGGLKGLTEGVPITNDVLEDIRKLHGMIAEDAKQEFRDKVQGTNATYGSKVDADGIISKAAPSVIVTPSPAAKVPPGVPAGAKVQQDTANPGNYRYSTDGGRTWVNHSANQAAPASVATDPAKGPVTPRNLQAYADYKYPKDPDAISKAKRDFKAMGYPDAQAPH